MKSYTLNEIRDYISSNFELDAQNRLVRKNPGPNVIIIDYISLTNDKDKLQHTRRNAEQPASDSRAPRDKTSLL